MNSVIHILIKENYFINNNIMNSKNDKDYLYLYKKYKQKYLYLKNGGALPSNPSHNDDKERPKFPVRSRSEGYQTEVDPTTLACTNITDIDPITLEPITSIPSNRLIIFQSGRCVDVLNFLNYRIMDKKYRDPMTRNVFSNELIEKVREKLIELGQNVPDWMNDYDENTDQVNDDIQEEDEEEEYVYESDSDNDSQNEEDSGISERQIRSDLKKKASNDISMSPYQSPLDMIHQAKLATIDNNTVPPSLFSNQFNNEEEEEKFYHAEIVNILYKLVKFKKSEIDDNRVKKLAFLLYLAIDPETYGEDRNPAFKFISNNFAEGGLDFSGVFNKIKDISVGEINDLINTLFPIEKIPIGILLAPNEYWKFMKYNKTTQFYQYLTLEQIVEVSSHFE